MSKQPRKVRDGISGLRSRDSAPTAPGRETGTPGPRPGVSGLKSRNTESRDTDQPPSLLDHLWFRLLAAAWVLAVVLIYYRLQIMRLLQVLPR